MRFDIERCCARSSTEIQQLGRILMAWIFKEVNRPPKKKEQEDTPDYSGPFWNYKDLIPPPEGFEYPE